MKRGKFEAVHLDASGAELSGKRRLRWLLILAPVLVLAVLAAVLIPAAANPETESSTEAKGLTREENMNLYRWIANLVEREDMVLTILPDDPEPGAEPIVLTIPPSMSRVRVDLNGLAADLDEGMGKYSIRRFHVDPARYISLDRNALWELAEQTAEAHNQALMEPFAALETHSMGQNEAHVLVVNPGRTGVYVSTDEIYDTLMDAYQTGELAPSMDYEVRTPKTLDLEAIHEELCTPPVDATLDDQTFAITPEVPGYGFEPEELEQLLEGAEPGKAGTLTLHVIEPEITAADVEASLYAVTIAESHTPHVWNDDRTTNLILACEAINGTTLMPGDVFSFNEVVGERTVAKGYREATVYGSGGASVPETGGGVCQVASSIYYAVLQANLETVERHAHMFLVTYVPQGMDAAIYWGRLDYRFKNDSPFPIKIEASVSDGLVHIYLKGTEWRDYTVKLYYEVLEEFPYETTYQYVYDGSYGPGETIVTPYTGYRIATYKTIVGLDGEVRETSRIATSLYNKRDKVIAAMPPQPTETTAAPDDD